MAKKDKGDFMSRAGKVTKKGIRESKKFAIGIGKKTTGEQRFLGKTLPKSLWKVAKWGFKHPISATALTFVPAAMRKLAKSPGLKFPKHRQFDKRGRKII